MADLTGKLIANSYRNLLQAPGPNNDGLASGQSITIQDGSGNNSGLALSQAGVALTGTINIQGSQFTGTGSQLNTAVANAGTFVVGMVAQNGAQSFGRTLTASTGVSISNANGTSGNPTFSLADSGVTSATYGPTTMLNIDSTGRIISTDTTAVISATTFESSNVNAQYGNFSTDVSVGGQLTVTGSFQPTNISTSIVSATNVVASVATINNLTVSGNVTATAYYGDGSNLTGIVAASATNASYAASAGEAAVAVSAYHATSANTAQFASSATNATNAVSAVFATSATNATNAVSAVFASSATNATTAITVNYGGVVQTSTANIGDVSASSLFVSGNVSANGTLTIGGQVSVGGGIKVIGDVSAGNIIAGGIIYGDGAGLFNVPSAQGGTVNFVKAGTGIHVTIDGTTTTNPITASGTLALNADQSFGTVSATSFVLSGLGALITDTSATALVTALSATMATSIDNSNTNITTNTNAITSINAVLGDGSGFATDAELAAVSSTLATSIGNTNANVTTNINAITSINSILGDGTGFATDAELAAVSATLATSINNSNTNITTNTNAITSINSVIGDGSGFATDAELAALSATMATSIGNSNTLIAATSLALATSIGNTNANVTTNINAITSINSILGDGTGFATDAELAAVSVALATSIGNSNTNITTNTNAITSINSILGDGTGFATDAELAAVSATLATSISNQMPKSGGTFTGTVSHGDNVKAQFGASNDLQIYHDGSNSFIDDAGTGSSNIRGSQVNIGKYTGEDMITAVADGAVTLYHNNAAKLATTANGVAITGDVTFNDGGKATFGGGSDLQIYHDGSNSYITDSGTGDLVINTNGNAISLNPNGGGEYGLRVINNGAVNLYHDNSLKLATNSSGVEVSDSSTQGLVKLGQIHMKNSSGSFVSGSDGVIHLPYTDGHYYVDNYDGGILFRTTSYGGLLSLFSTGLYAYRNTIGNVQTATNVSGNITPDLATYNSFVWTLQGNTTLLNPTTEGTGMSGVFIFIHSGAARTVSLGTDWETAGGAGLTLSGAAGAVDIVPYFVKATGSILLGTPMLAFS